MFFYFFFLLFLSSLFFFEAVFGHLFFFKNSEKSVSGRLGGTPPVGKNAFREGLAPRSLPRHVWEAILRRSWEPSWGSKFYFFVKKKFKRASERLRERFLGGSETGLKIRDSWEAFLIDFWTVSGAPGGGNMWFPYWQG